MTESIDLTEKGLDPEVVAQRAMADDEWLDTLLLGIGPARRPTPVRENCAGALRWLSAHHPDVLLPHWDYFVGLLSSGNGFSQFPAVYILADLLRIDDAGRFEAVFETFFGLLDDPSVMIAGHVAGLSGRIARLRPALCPRITEALLSIDATRHEPSRKELVKSYIIQALDEYFDLAGNPEAIIAFVQAQVESSSPRTKKLASAFLEAHASPA